jgi:hypothetical protein
MTSLSLLLWIALGVAPQVALWLGIGFWRHWQEYQTLRGGVPTDGQALPAFLPGQFLTFRLDLPTEQIIRCYSLSDAPYPDYYRVSIKRVPAPAGKRPLDRNSRLTTVGRLVAAVGG